MIEFDRYASIQLARDDRGKPFLASKTNPEVLFNVSHQGDYTVLVGAHGVNTEEHQLGVDVMKLEYLGGKNQEEFFRIMNRNFSPKVRILFIYLRICVKIIK
jgi:phosphopantetheinyl transferase